MGNVEGEQNAVSSADHFPFTTEDNFTDVVLIVEDQQIFTNRSLLAYASPVFSCMFTDDFREREEKILNLPDKDHNTVSEMVAFLHPGVEFTLTTDSALRLLPLAEEYQIGVLKNKAEEVLMAELQRLVIPSTEFLLQCLETAEKCSLPNLLDICVKSYADPDRSLGELKESTDVSLATKSRIYETRISRLESEKEDIEGWKMRISAVKTRLKEIILPHDEHCRCRTEIKLRSTLQRCCSYCMRNWCSDNVSTDAYKASYWFFCNHKVGFHITHDATIRTFMEAEET